MHKMKCIDDKLKTLFLNVVICKVYVTKFTELKSMNEVYIA